MDVPAPFPQPTDSPSRTEPAAAIGMLVGLSTALMALLVAPFVLGWLPGDALAGVVPVGQFAPLFASWVVWRWLLPHRSLPAVWALRPRSASTLVGGLAVVTLAIAAVGSAHVALGALLGVPVALPDGFWSTIPLAIVLALVLAIPCFGEEVAWRGHLFTLLDRHRGWGRVVATTVLWPCGMCR